MAGLCLHRELAFRLREHRRFGQHAPFAIDVPAVWRAFLAGSAGPDMGYFPGGTRLVSDLAHYERSGELCRALVSQAECDRQRAYAWGWVAHVVADQILHPLVNRGVGAYLNGDANREIAYAESPGAHVQVELGLDAYWIDRAPRSGVRCVEERDRNERNRDEQTAEARVASRAFWQTYGVDFERPLAKSQRAVNRWMGMWFLTARTHSRRRGWGDRSIWQRGVALAALLPGRLLTSLVSRKSAKWGVFRALPPDDWLTAECAQRMQEFEERFVAQLAAGVPDLPNYNLDTGKIDPADAPYPLAVAAREALERLTET